MSTPDMKSPLTGCTTIDSTTPDGYLDNARAGNPDAGANATTKQAAKNLLASEKLLKTPGPANLVGHGCEGDIDTGKATGQCIRWDNVKDWKDDMASLVHWTTELYLFGCTVGAGKEGAQLLFELAKVIDAPVSAPTGLIYCNKQGDFRLEKGAVWQTATPTTLPAPIDPPSHTQVSPSMDKANALIPGGSDPARIVSAVYTPYGQAAVPAAQAMALASEVIWDQPFSTEDDPGAKVTGHLEVTVVAGSLTATRSLYVLGHTLVKDPETSRYFNATPQFRRLLGKK